MKFTEERFVKKFSLWVSKYTGQHFICTPVGVLESYEGLQIPSKTYTKEYIARSGEFEFVDFI